MVRNILFIMCDQLRWDYLSCAGHPTLQTPNIDRLARMGVSFDRCYVQSPVCGPSRMSFYTGRTVFSHGSTWNNVPLPVGEYTLGDYLRPQGVRVGVAGKTHVVADAEGLVRLGLGRDSDIGRNLAEGGFEPFERDDGLHPTGKVAPDLSYNAWLRERGYPGENPWHDHANAGRGPDGEVLSGWYLRNSGLPADIREEDSETPYITDRGMAFIEDSGAQPWLLHLSYIKPHWPYIAPAPYHAMYSASQILPVHRDPRELDEPHPVYRAFTEMAPGKVFSEPEVRDLVVPVYMGLVRQIDDHLGRLFDWLEASGRMQDTMIVFTSDHGDYLGDHWLGEKELFHEASVRVPLIIYDPDPAADATRGTRSDSLVESIDLVPTFLEAMAAPAADHRLEGQSLLPFIRGTGPAPVRDCVFSEIDFGFYKARRMVGSGASDSRAYMIRTERWKYIHYKGFRPQLFDLDSDPDEFIDLGASAAHAPVRADLQALLLDRLTSRKNRVGISDAAMDARMGKSGVIIGTW